MPIQRGHLHGMAQPQAEHINGHDASQFLTIVPGEEVRPNAYFEDQCHRPAFHTVGPAPQFHNLPVGHTGWQADFKVVSAECHWSNQNPHMMETPFVLAHHPSNAQRVQRPDAERMPPRHRSVSNGYWWQTPSALRLGTPGCKSCTAPLSTWCNRLPRLPDHARRPGWLA